MTYDITFCTFWRDCYKGRSCFRALTPEIEEAATMELSMFFDVPDCYATATAVATMAEKIVQGDGSEA